MALTPEDRDYLTILYEENAEHARHHETLRATAASLFIALIAGVLAFAAGENNQRIFVSGFIVCVVSFIGWIVNYKHTERYELHLNRLNGYREAAEFKLSNQVLGIGANRDKEHDEKFWFTSKYIKLRVLWSVIYIATFLIGLMMIVWPQVLKIL